MGESKTLAQFCGTMQAIFEVTCEDIERDVPDLVKKQQEQKLISTD